MGVTSGIIVGVLAAGSAVYSADQQRASNNANLRAQAARDVKAEASKTQATKLPGQQVGIDPAKIGAAIASGGGAGPASNTGTLSGALLGGGSSPQNTGIAPPPSTLLGG